MFKYVIENNLMPPWFVDPNTGPWKDDLSLTPKEKLMLLEWVEEGSPKGSEVGPPLWRAEKNLELPADYTIFLPEKVVIPAEGSPFIYKRFLISNSFKEDKWIKSVKFLLKPKVIHHVNLMIVNSSFDKSDIKKAPLQQAFYCYIRYKLWTNCIYSAK